MTDYNNLFYGKNNSEFDTVPNIGKILIIDDQPLNLKILTLLLENIGFDHIDKASTGTEGLRLYKNNNYSIVLLDIGLPDINGIDVCKAMKKSSTIKNIPIIAVTAFYDIKKECMQAGFDDFIQKPLNINTLKGVLNRWMPKE